MVVARPRLRSQLNITETHWDDGMAPHVSETHADVAIVFRPQEPLPKMMRQ
jgi:hypothetical protein